MIRTTMSPRIALLCAGLGISLSMIAAAPADAQNQNMEIIQHPNYDKNVFMPFVPASQRIFPLLILIAGTNGMNTFLS